MKQQDVFKKVGTILKELNEQYEYLSEEPSQLNELELELFAANANFLKDHTEILRKLAHKSITTDAPRHAPVPPQPPAEARPPQPPVEATAQPANIKEDKQETVYQEKFFEPVVQRLAPGAGMDGHDDDAQAEAAENMPAGSEPETIRHELIIDDADTWEDEDEELYDADDILEEPADEVFEPIVGEGPDMPEEAEEEPEPVTAEEPPVEAVETEPIKAMPAEEPAKPEVKEPTKDEPVRTINQRMSEQLGEKKDPALLPVIDLKSAITLNDKLLYIKDLFNGYSLAYSEAIEILNRFTTLEEAQRFLNTNYVNKNNWESKPATTSKFYDLLKRRYS